MELMEIIKLHDFNEDDIAKFEEHHLQKNIFSRGNMW